MLTNLFIKSQNFIELNALKYKRYFILKHKFEHRLSIITGARGIGKTTMIAQYIKDNYNDEDALYVSLDDVQNISEFTMLRIAEEFSLNGGKLLCFDEIHKYPNWSGELKTIYDNYPNLKIIATGSSALHINKGSHDLSRRAIVYKMYGMSFREFLELHYDFELNAYSFENILNNHRDISKNIISVLDKKDMKIIPLFKKYLKYGYYPYYLSMPNEIMFFQTLKQNINVTLEGDLLSIYPKLNGNSIRKIKQLFAVILKSVPMEVKISTLKKATDITDDRTLKEYLAKLDDAGLIKLLMKSSLNMKSMDKPHKIYIANTNLMYTGEPNTGNIRETFFVNQVDNYYNEKNNFLSDGVFASDKGDFLVDEKYIIEVGGKNKSFSQIKDLPNSFIASDDIEIGFGAKIPLWLFGFLY